MIEVDDELLDLIIQNVIDHLIVEKGTPYVDNIDLLKADLTDALQ